MSIQYIDVSRPKEIPSSLQQVEFEKDELKIYNNYVYSILECDITANIPADYDPAAFDFTDVNFTDYIITRSYAEEDQASIWCDRVNLANDDLSIFPESPMSAHLLSTFGSYHAKFTTDPVTGKIHIKIRKASYFKNELHGSILETEQTWH
jgi:hypothetical protein